MKLYQKPEFHFVHNASGLDGNEMVKQLDEDPAECFKNCNYAEEKKKYCIKSGYILREIAGEYAIVPVDEECLISNAVMTPNDSAVFLWKVFQQPSTMEDAVRKGVREYEAAEETIRNSVHRFVMDALKHQILEEVKEK